MMDTWFGHFMDRFYELGLQKNTVIVLLSDHGYLLGERGLHRQGAVPAPPGARSGAVRVVHPDGRRRAR